MHGGISEINRTQDYISRSIGSSYCEINICEIITTMEIKIHEIKCDINRRDLTVKVKVKLTTPFNNKCNTALVKCRIATWQN